MSSIHLNIRFFAREPPATAADYGKVEWLDLAPLRKIRFQIFDPLRWLDLDLKSRVCRPVGSAAPVARVIARPGATSFPLFGKLVVELQNKIWVMVSLRYSRVINIIEEDVDVVLHPQDDEYTVVGAKRPSFLNSCKGALSAMVGIYQPMFQLTPGKYHGSKKGIFVNRDIDRINFISQRFLYGEAPPLGYIGGLKHREEFGMIRHVCLPIQEFHDNFQNVAKVIHKLPLLESLLVIAQLVDLTLQGTVCMEFAFEDVKLSRPSRRPRSDMQIKVMSGGLPVFGMAAVDILFNSITSPTHQAGILESLGRVETMMRQESNLPSRVVARFTYRNHN